MNTADWQSVKTCDGGLALRLSPGWTVQSTGLSHDEVLAASPSDDYQPMLSVRKEPLDEPRSAKDYKTGNVIYLQETSTDYRDHGGGEWASGGNDISWHSYSASHGGQEQLTFLCFFVVISSAAYTVSCGALAEDYSKYCELIEMIGRTLNPVLR